ncbi:hypothetical protein LOAG_07913 [Loa loa]|nr:hypothetical protein LOAG_07913 [Loa loa]EFO20578.1 hypothetical protein LOAG_07913 [Loa loa]
MTICATALKPRNEQGCANRPEERKNGDHWNEKCKKMCHYRANHNNALCSASKRTGMEECSVEVEKHEKPEIVATTGAEVEQTLINPYERGKSENKLVRIRHKQIDTVGDSLKEKWGIPDILLGIGTIGQLAISNLIKTEESG